MKNKNFTIQKFVENNWINKKSFNEKFEAEQELKKLKKTKSKYRLIEVFSELTAENWFKDFCQKSKLTPIQLEKKLISFSKKLKKMQIEKEKNNTEGSQGLKKKSSPPSRHLSVKSK